MRAAVVRRSAAAERKDDAIEHVARRLLVRYGVVFWRLLEREAARLPAWRELLRVYRRLESRGEVRGGRFVAGFSGEQFALPEAIGMLRATRRQPTADQWVSVSGADPLNLVGILTPGPKLPAPWPATGCCTATVFRRPCWPRITFSFLNLSTLRASGPRRKRC